MMRPVTSTLTTLLTLCALCALTSTAYAGPWVKAPGEVYAKVSGGLFDSETIFDVDGQEVSPPFVYSNTGVYTYAELGLFPRGALAISLPFLMSTNTVDERSRFNRSGFGDLDLIFQGQVYRGAACAVSGEMGLRVPLYDGVVAADGEAPGVDTSGAARFLPLLGDGSVDVNPGFGIGCSLFPVPGWVTWENALIVRTRGFGPGVRTALGLGIFIWPDRVALTGRAELLKRFSAENQRPTKEYLNVGGGLMVRLWQGIALEASASALPWGAFIARGYSATVGVSYTGRVFANPFE